MKNSNYNDLINQSIENGSKSKKKYDTINDAIADFKENAAICKTIPYDIGPHTLSQAAQDMLQSEFFCFCDDQKDNDDIDGFNNAVFELIRNAYMIDFYNAENQPQFSMSLRQIQPIISAFETISVETNNENCLFFGKICNLPETLLDKSIRHISGNDFGKMIITVS